ncbi:MAG: antibiotic biosynthesis monooxygenase family protein [Phototrophicaceae bacterium]|jgi:heme-degrading monooxygenase HmoA
MILEIANLIVQPSQQPAYEAAFKQAVPLIANSHGYIRHELHRCVETPGRYMLFVWWQTLEDHTKGFRGSAAYQEWRTLLHRFYSPGFVVEHYNLVNASPE